MGGAKEVVREQQEKGHHFRKGKIWGTVRDMLEKGAWHGKSAGEGGISEWPGH